MRRVLVVDDNRAIRATLADALDIEGFVVDVAADGAAALAFHARTTPDIVLVDLMLPGTDGVSVARSLASAGCLAPVVVVTADRGGAERAREIGAAFLAKPFDLEALLELIDRLVPP